jgi:hypothetical protein
LREDPLANGYYARPLSHVACGRPGEGLQAPARVSEGLNGLRVVRGFARERNEETLYTLGQHTVVRKHGLATNTQRSVALVWDLVMPLTQVTILRQRNPGGGGRPCRQRA